MSATSTDSIIQRKVVDEAEVGRMLSLEEGHYIDLKQADIRPAKLTEAVSAFANTAGGELFVGIGERITSAGKERFWAGFADLEAANGHIQAIEALSPLGKSLSSNVPDMPRPSWICNASGHLQNKGHSICVWRYSLCSTERSEAARNWRRRA